MVTACTATAIQ